MTVDSIPGDRKAQTHVNIDRDNDKLFHKSHRLFHSKSLLYPILLALLLIIGTVLLVITITRRNTCQQLQAERIEALPHDLKVTWVPCVKTSKSSLCACPASFIHSSVNPSHCIPSHTRCLHSCQTNPHCVCHNLLDASRCRDVTRQWIESEYQIGPVEDVHNVITTNVPQHHWSEHANHLVEHLLVDRQSGERLFFSADRRTAITINRHEDDYLLNERWTKIETNTTQQHIVYTQLDPELHSCRMSSIHDDGAVIDGSVHTCPGATTMGAPYYLAAACQDILVLWHGPKHSNIRRQEGWVISRHNFEAAMPRLPVLLDPFHRYYSLYNDLMVEIKDLNGDVLAQLFTDVERPTKFQFIDQYGTILVANQTHMQLLTSTNKEAWLDI